MATIFVTFPLRCARIDSRDAREGSEQEQAALTLGASGWQTFWHVTLPSVKWGLLYGVILCNARAMGEFGAVYVVSGHITGETETMPLRVERLYNESRCDRGVRGGEPAGLAGPGHAGRQKLVEWKTRDYSSRTGDHEEIAPSMSIELKNVSKHFGEVTAVNGVNFSVKEGELMALLGPSGGGKTTVLRMIAGLEMPTTGDMFIRGQRVNDIPGAKTQHRICFPELRVVQEHDGVQEHRLRPEDQEMETPGD